MLNRKPIFVNGFSRGGTNITMNILLSHPFIVMPSGELNKVIKGKGMGDRALRRLYKKILYDLPIRLIAGNLFDRFDFKPRKDVSSIVKRYIDFILWIEKQFAMHEGHNKWKDEFTRYKVKEIRKGRIVAKTHDGLVFLNNMFREMYGAVRFVAVVRCGYAVCESLARRGWEIENAAHLYNVVGKEILSNCDKDDYLIVKFEDILQSPLETIDLIYSHCNLDTGDCKKFRLQHKPIASRNSKISVLHGSYDRQLVWFERKALPHFFVPDVNTIQIERLTDSQKKKIQRIAGGTMSRLGYCRR